MRGGHRHAISIVPLLDYFQGLRIVEESLGSRDIRKVGK